MDIGESDNMAKLISQAVIKRMPRYYRYLGDLLDSGVERISSDALSVKMNVTASQIRQDLNNFGGFGQQGYGYNVKYLHDEIGKILGVDKSHKAIIIGAGNLGQAIANYGKFEKRGFVVVALFDVNLAMKDITVRGKPVLMMEQLEAFIEKNDIEIAVLTMPKERAKETCNRLINTKIKAIWNFAHIDLEVPNDIVVQNVHLSDSLMQLTYNMTQIDREKS